MIKGEEKRIKKDKSSFSFDSGAKPIVHRGDGSGVPDQTTRSCFPVLLVLSANSSIVSISLVNPKKRKEWRGEGCSDPFLLRAKHSIIISRKAFQFQVCTLLGTNPSIASFSLVKLKNSKRCGMKGGKPHGPSLGEVRLKPFPTPPSLGSLSLPGVWCFSYAGLKRYTN